MANRTYRVSGHYVAAAVATDSEAGSQPDNEGRQPGAASPLRLLLAFPYRQPRPAAAVHAAREELRPYLRFLRMGFPSQLLATRGRG